MVNGISILQGMTINLLAVTGLFVAVWMVSVLKRDAGIVDRVWGPGFILVALLTAFWGAGWSGRKVLILLPVAVWGIRLSRHIWRRSRGKPEDFRYRVFREKGGERFWLTSLWNIFLLQAGLLFVIALPLMTAQMVPAPREVTGFDLAGIVLWTAGFLMEALADAQLSSFLSDPDNTGKVMRYGLWRYSRHPNYFGECLIWWGFFLIALSVPCGYLSLPGPLLITVLLLKVSGVPMLEKGLAARREGYAQYVRDTPAFIPLHRRWGRR